MLICNQPGKLFPRAFFLRKNKKRLQRRAGNPRPTKSRLRVKCSCFTITRGSESPFVHCTQPYRRAGNPPSSGTREHSSRYHGFACQPLRGLVTSRNGELSNESLRNDIRPGGVSSISGTPKSASGTISDLVC